MHRGWNHSNSFNFTAVNSPKFSWIIKPTKDHHHPMQDCRATSVNFKTILIKFRQNLCIFHGIVPRKQIRSQFWLSFICPAPIIYNQLGVLRRHTQDKRQTANLEINNFGIRATFRNKFSRATSIYIYLILSMKIIFITDILTRFFYIFPFFPIFSHYFFHYFSISLFLSF